MEGSGSCQPRQQGEGLESSNSSITWKENHAGKKRKSLGEKKKLLKDTATTEKYHGCSLKKKNQFFAYGLFRRYLIKQTLTLPETACFSSLPLCSLWCGGTSRACGEVLPWGCCSGSVFRPLWACGAQGCGPEAQCYQPDGTGQTWHRVSKADAPFLKDPVLALEVGSPLRGGLV